MLTVFTISRLIACLVKRHVHSGRSDIRVIDAGYGH